jgi:hypothetical protein
MANYDEVLNLVMLLTLEEKLQLLVDLATLIRQQILDQPEYRIREIKGIGKEAEEGIDVEKSWE